MISFIGIKLISVEFNEEIQTKQFLLVYHENYFISVYRTEQPNHYRQNYSL